ncbi:MAG: ribonuclease P protein component [Thermoguttaceae bacterium]|nr:ribonuclease P protein component [Thermoguttaceae bacterium]
MDPNYSFPKSQHVRRQLDFTRIYSVKTAYNNGVLLVYAARNDLGYPRLGLSVSKKVGKAHARNRWKRIIREAFRLQQSEFADVVLKTAQNENRTDITPEIAAGIDFIVIPKKIDVEPNFKEICKSLKYCVKRASEKLFQLRMKKDLPQLNAPSVPTPEDPQPSEGAPS